MFALFFMFVCFPPSLFMSARNWLVIMSVWRAIHLLILNEFLDYVELLEF